jgi:phosphate transport system protein
VIALESLGELGEYRELRRNYHDRISDLRAQSSSILACALRGVRAAYAAATDVGVTSPGTLDFGAARSLEVVTAADHQVLALLALESPVARDLRVILAARDVTQISQLCVGLATTLVSRIAAVRQVSDPTLKDLVRTVGSRTADLLQLAEAAWTTLDPGTAQEVLSESEGARRAQVDFLARLLGLTEIRVAAAVDLALTARAYDRLADHAMEIAERTLFAAGYQA